MDYKTLSKLCHTAGYEKRIDLIIEHIELVKQETDKDKYNTAANLNIAAGDINLIIKVVDKCT